MSSGLEGARFKRVCSQIEQGFDMRLSYPALQAAQDVSRIVLRTTDEDLVAEARRIQGDEPGSLIDTSREMRRSFLMTGDPDPVVRTMDFLAGNMAVMGTVSRIRKTAEPEDQVILGGWVARDYVVGEREIARDLERANLRPAMDLSRAEPGVTQHKFGPRRPGPNL